MLSTGRSKLLGNVIYAYETYCVDEGSYWVYGLYSWLKNGLYSFLFLRVDCFYYSKGKSGF
jgi:hypothetical protein